MNELANIDTKATALFDKVSLLIEQARCHVATMVNIAEAYTKYYIGQHISLKKSIQALIAAVYLATAEIVNLCLLDI